jgi:hypothetical protein
MDDFDPRTKTTHSAAEYAAGWVVVLILALLFVGGFLITLRPWG